MRRLIIEEPTSRAALWSRRLAVFGLCLAVIAVLASRSGGVDPHGAVAVLAAALLFGVAALLAAAVASVVIWRTGHPGIGPALGGIALALGLLAYPAWLSAKAVQLPQIADVSTDWTNPPGFSRAAKAVAARRGAMHDPPGEPARQAQARAYPDVQPLTLELGAEEAYKAALKVVAARRWRVIEAQPPAGRPAVGHIEAVAKTTVMGFPDDVAIRIAATAAAQCRVDFRSASRFGRTDLGDNAARIKALSSELEDAADE